MVDDGAELLLAAVCLQARADLEAVFSRVMLLRKACERGRLAEFLATERLPLATEEERTALWWFSDRRYLPAELAAMVRTVGRYRRFCLNCCRPAGRDGDGRVVQRR